MAAQSLWRSESAPGAFYRRLSSRMDKPRANTAAAQALARTVCSSCSPEVKPLLTSARATAVGFQVNSVGTAA